jgi:hypothetical protein
MTSAEDFTAACGHLVPPGARFCPECGQPRAVTPSGNSEPVTTGQTDPPHSPDPPRWPWEISDDDELHAVQSDPTVVPPYYQQADQRSTGPLPKGPSEPPRGGRRNLLLMITGGVAVVVIVVAAVVLLNRHPGTAAAGDASATVRATHTASRPTPKPTPSASPSPDYAQLRATPEGKAAVALAGLLKSAVIQLGDVSGSIAKVRGCKPDLSSDQHVFYAAAGDRRRLLNELATMSGRSALPSALLRDLTSAWQSSAQDYTDLALWTDDALYHGCSKATIDSDANYRASERPGAEAMQDKEAFVRLWDPIAARYDLAIYPYWEL